MASPTDGNISAKNTASRRRTNTDEIAPGRAKFISTTIEEIREQHWRQILHLFDALYDPYPFADLTVADLERLFDAYTNKGFIQKVE